jgi:phosphate uptake regulator
MLGFREIYAIWRRDNSLAQAIRDSYAMLEKTHGMFRSSVQRLRTGEAAKVSLSVHEEDRIINEYQIEVRKKVLRYLAITGTVDLIPGLVLTSIIIDIERIGDYTKNITELAMVQQCELKCGSFEPLVCDLEKTVERLFCEVPPLLASSNRQVARKLCDECSWLRKGADDVLVELIKGADESLSRGQTAATALYVRYLKRVGAHLLNILSSVVNPFERIGYRVEDRDSGRFSRAD